MDFAIVSEFFAFYAGVSDWVANGGLARWTSENKVARSIIAGFIPVVVAYDRFRQTMEKTCEIHASAFYSELDKVYADLLKIAIERPYLRQPVLLHGDDDLAIRADYDPFPDVRILGKNLTETEVAAKRAEYDAYAFIVWNFIETIHDRCYEYPDKLLETWATIVAAEDRIHRGWFLAQMRNEAFAAHKARAAGGRHYRTDKFCSGFQVFVYERNFLDDPIGDIRDRKWTLSWATWAYACITWPASWFTRLRPADDPRARYRKWPYQGRDTVPDIDYGFLPTAAGDSHSRP
jgi:hypothetical protein